MKLIIYSLTPLILVFTSCKKNYQCECKNANTTYIAGEKEGTKSNVKKYCQDLSLGDTKCSLKQ